MFSTWTELPYSTCTQLPYSRPIIDSPPYRPPWDTPIIQSRGQLSPKKINLVEYPIPRREFLYDYEPEYHEPPYIYTYHRVTYIFFLIWS
jgi:hypothetical protein